MVPYSVQDTTPSRSGLLDSQAVNKKLQLVRHSENLGYQRYWMSPRWQNSGERSDSAEQSMLCGYLAAHTEHIKIGLSQPGLSYDTAIQPDDQYTALAALYVGRIDLDTSLEFATMASDANIDDAIVRQPCPFLPDYLFDLQSRFHRQLKSLPSCSPPVMPVKDGASGLWPTMPVWISGSTPQQAMIAGMLGLPFVFQTPQASSYVCAAVAATYREHFQRSTSLSEPYLIVTLTMLLADCDVEANHLFHGQPNTFFRTYPQSTALHTPSPHVHSSIACLSNSAHPLNRPAPSVLVGSINTVKAAFWDYLTTCQPDEIMALCPPHAEAVSIRSLELIADLCNRQPARARTGRMMTTSASMP